jgi:hypothetical protein
MTVHRSTRRAAYSRRRHGMHAEANWTASARDLAPEPPVLDEDLDPEPTDDEIGEDEEWRADRSEGRA